jgi:uncharacterized protein (TIGR00369 family)
LKLNYDPAYQGCFVCGKQNPRGLRLDFTRDTENDEIVTRLAFTQEMQGFENIVHGGFVSMILDEAMAKACLEKGIPAVTAKIELRFKKPVRVGEEIEVRGKVIEAKGKKVFTRARCTGRSGELKAHAEGFFLKV